jgi:hypothetical protein
MSAHITLYIGVNKPDLEHQQAQLNVMCHEEFDLYTRLLTQNNVHATQQATKTCMFRHVVDPDLEERTEKPTTAAMRKRLMQQLLPLGGLHDRTGMILEFRGR